MIPLLAKAETLVPRDCATSVLDTEDRHDLLFHAHEPGAPAMGGRSVDGRQLARRAGRLIGAMTLARISRQALLIAPVRIALALVGLVVALLLGGNEKSMLLAFAIGTFGTAFAVVADRRGGIFAPRSDPEPAPADASLESGLELVRHAVLPSTVGVSILAAIAFAVGQLALGALLAGAIAGLGLAALAYGAALAWQERADGAALYLDRRGGRVYTGAPR